ncbi:MAG: DUF4129 domain-containing protein [Roseiflexaceae bacterium]
MNKEQRTKDKEQNTIHRWFIIVAVVFSVLCSLFSAPAAAQEQPPDLPTYTAWVREAFAAAQRSDRLGLEEVGARLATTTSVRLPAGQHIAVDNGWLHAALVEGEPDLRAIEARLGAILDALAQPPSSAPADARERLHEILSKPPFQQPEPATSNWWNDFWDWVARALEALVRPVGSVPAAASQTLGWVILGIGALLLAGLIGYLLIGLRRTIAAEAHAAADDPAAGLTARTALDQASQVARDGDYRSAMRYLYLSALLWLDERDLLRYDRALTNREYLERLRGNPALRERLRPVVETFDRVWYGHVALDAESFAAYRAQVEALRTEN